MFRSPAWWVALAVLIVALLAPKTTPPRVEIEARAVGEESPQSGGRLEVASAVGQGETEEISGVTEALADGRALRFVGTEDFGRFLFRPVEAVSEEFRVSLGSAGNVAMGSSEVKAFRGRALGVGRWDAAGESSLVQVGSQLAGHLRLPNGEILHVRTNPDTGAGEAFIEDAHSGRPCAIDFAAGTASVLADETDAPESDPWERAFPIEIEPEPPTMASSGRNPNNDNLQFTDRPIPYGDAYQNSLKDARVLVVVDKGATGSDSANNINSKTAQFVSLMSNIAALYEDQLGLRLIVHELILTPNTDDYGDVAGGTGSLSDFRSWVSSNRPRSSYNWTMAAKFGQVSGALGIAYVSGASGSNGVSINRVGAVNTPAHEMGHNMGSGHTSGGVMNPTINSSRNFFTDLESNSSRTGARSIWNYMSNGGAGTQGRLSPSSRRLRHAEEIPFGDDDVVTAFPNQPVRFRPLANDETSVRHGATNTLRLVEAGAVFPGGAGETRVDGDEIVFTPAPGFDGTAWFSYTLGGDVGNSGEGWLHKGDVAVNVGRTTGPPSTGGPTGTPDFYHTGGSPITLYPLLNDNGDGFLNLAHVAPTLGTSGVGIADANGMYIAGAVLLDPDKGSFSAQTLRVYLAGGSSVNRIRSITFTPAAGAAGPARIRYTVADADGSETDVIATVLLGQDDEILAPDAALRYKVPTNDSEDEIWFDEGFDDSAWTAATGGVGYERGSGYEGLIGGDTETAMYNTNSSVFVRVPFVVNGRDEITGLRLSVQYDDGFVAYLNGTELRRRRVPEGANAWDTAADSNHEAEANAFSNYDISSFLGLLREGENLLCLHGANDGADSSDMLVRAKLTATRRFSTSRMVSPAGAAFAIPAGAGIELEAEVGLSTEPPFAAAPVSTWSAIETPLGGAAFFADDASPSTEVRFSKPGRYLLRLRCAEGGYNDDRLVRVHAGQPTLGVSLMQGVDAGLDRIIEGREVTLSSTTFPSSGQLVEWTQVDGATAAISDPMSATTTVTFPADGTYRFRAQVGAVFDEVTIVSGRGRVPLVKSDGLGRWAVPTSADDLSDGAGVVWRSPSFNDARWERGTAGFGYERDLGYLDWIGTSVGEAIYDNSTSILVRHPFWLPVEAERARSFRIGVRVDDGFVAWINASEIGRVNAPAGTPSWNTSASSSNPDEDAVVLQTFPVSGSAVVQGANHLAVHGMNSGLTSSDLLLASELTAEVEAGGALVMRPVVPSAPARVLFPGPGSLPAGWSELGFDDASWHYSAAAIGYEEGNGGYEHHFHSDTEVAMADRLPGALLRVPFVVPAGESVADLVLDVQYDDAFIAYLDGVEIARRGFAGVAAGDSAADSGHPDGQALVPESFAIPGTLAAGPHVFAAHVMNDAISSSDLLFVPTLSGMSSGSDPYEDYIAAFYPTGSPDALRSADPDGDGLDNALEFFLGGDAAGGGGLGAAARPVAPMLVATADDSFSLQFWRREGVAYQLQGSPDAASWFEVAPRSETSAPSGVPDYQAVVLELPAAGAAAFFRLEIDIGG